MALFSSVRFNCLVAIAFVCALDGFHAVQADTSPLQEQANAAIALMTFTVIPDVTASDLTIEDDGGEVDLVMALLGGGATVSDRYPLYLEGTLGFSRYDPRLILADEVDPLVVGAEWTTESATGGIGWNFRVNRSWVFRPIVNVSVGTLSGGLSAAGQEALAKAGRGIVDQIGDRLNFLIDGRLNTYGLGGSLMLDYELFSSRHDVDIELRYSFIHLRSFGSTSEAVQGSSNADNASVYVRRRAPLGVTVLSRPLRYVLEGAHTTYFGDQRGFLGFDALNSAGFGIELDSSHYDVVVTRTRLVLRYMFGSNVSGYSVGLAVSF